MSNGSAEIDKPQLRPIVDRLRLGQIPQSAFSQLVDEAVQHAMVTVAPDGQAATRSWQNLGPRNIGGRIRTLAIHPRDGHILYAGSALGGVWKTTDVGDSWQVQDDFRPPTGAHQALPIGAIAVAPSSPETVYVGTGEPVTGYISGNGLFWSRNGGRHYTQIDHPDTGTIQAKHYERIRVDPWESRRLWCATPDRGLWRGSPGNPPTFVQDNIDASGLAVANQLATDIVIDFGDPRGTPPAQYTVFVALSGAGVFRATFIRADDDYDRSGANTWTRVNIPGLAALPGFNRVKLTLCETQPARMYCVAGVAGTGQFSPVFRSDNNGRDWNPTAAQTGSTSGITWYALVLECSPHDPDVVFIGQVDMWCTTDGGTTWGTPRAVPPNSFTPCLDFLQYGQGDRAQHADQQAVVFDRDRRNHVWVGNDGGISFSANLARTWRKRSHGILATQFVDISTHPTYPFMMGGGLQDNGSWITYGGLSWYHVGHSDGGDLGFDPNSARNWFVTAQQGVWRGQMAPAVGVVGGFTRPNPAPDITGGNAQSHGAFQSSGITNTDLPPFYAVLVHHPNNPAEAMVGRCNNAYRTQNGTNFTALGHGGFSAHGTGACSHSSQACATNSEVSTLAYGTDPDNDWWVGTSTGEIFYTPDGGTNWRNTTEPLATRGQWISALATHPTDSGIAAIAVASNPGTIYLTGNGGQNWLEISGRPGAGGANWQPRQTPNANDQFSPGPATALAFAPNSPGAASDQTLYVGCMTGVFVIRNARVPTTATPTPNFQPVWRTFNFRLPLVLVFDMEVVSFQDDNGTAHNLLRIATFGRGIYELDLDNDPATRLLIRRHIDDNGLALPDANSHNDEPRLAAGTNLVDDRSIDIRTDVAPFLYLGQVADSVEFDQQLGGDNLVAGQLNLVYIQVQNVGANASGTVDVSLYWAALGASTTVPDLPADFWTDYPKDEASPWTLIDTLQDSNIASGAPGIFRFQWQVPGTAEHNIALLALATDNDRDNLVSSTPTTETATLVTDDRRAALRIAPVTASPADALLRDGFDDRGFLGGTAWGANSHDIIVVQTLATPDPETEFAHADDRRASDVVDSDTSNHIYVRVNNRGSQNLSGAQVEVFQIPIETPHQPATWNSLGSVTMPTPAEDIAGNTAGFAPVINWGPTVADPAPYKHYLLAALVTTAADPRPDYEARIDSIASFWQLFIESVDSGNAALRAITWQA